MSNRRFIAWLDPSRLGEHDRKAIAQTLTSAHPDVVVHEQNLDKGSPNRAVVAVVDLGGGTRIFCTTTDTDVQGADICVNVGELRQILPVVFAIKARETRSDSTAKDSGVDHKTEAALAILGAEIGLWDWDLHKNLVYFSPEWKAQIGYLDHELENRFDEWERRLHPDDRNYVLSTVTRFVGLEIEKYETQFRFQHKDGTYRWILARAKIYLDDSGKPVHMSGAHTDITHLKGIEQKLERERQFNSLVIDTSPNLIFVKDIKGRFLLVNQAVADLFDTTKEAIVNAANEDVHHEKDEVDSYSEVDRRVVETRQEVRVEERFTRPNGEVLWFFTIKTPLIEPDGAVHVLGLSVDITERKKREEETLRILQSERELVEMKSRFITTISHEFRTPLTSIMSSAELLQMFGTGFQDAERTEYWNRIYKAIDRMTDLLDDVLFVNRSHSEDVRHDIRSMQIRDFLRALETEFRLTDQNQHILEFSVEPSEHTVKVDTRLVHEALANLISNALKFSAAGTLVRVSASAVGSDLVFKIYDEGIGIPEADKDAVYNDFFRGSNVGLIPGTGLGLTIVKNAARLLRGSVDFSKNDGPGSTFRLSIPVSQADDSHAYE